MVDIGAYEAGFGAGILFITLVLYKVSGIGVNMLASKYKNGKNGNGSSLSNSSESYAPSLLIDKDIGETKSVVYSIKNSQELNQQATLNCFKNMAEKEETQIKLLTDIRDSMIRQERK